MKKFLTVLLALSVVFTYTVGTAFALPSDETEVAGLDKAKAAAVAELEAYPDMAAYDTTGQAKVKAIVVEYTDKINDANSTNAVYATLTAAKMAINAVDKADAIAQAKKDATKQFKDYVYLFDTLEVAVTAAAVKDAKVGYDTYAGFKTAMLGAIDASVDVAGVEKVLDTALTKADKIYDQLKEVVVPQSKIDELVKAIRLEAGKYNVNTKDYSSKVVADFAAAIEEGVAAANAIETWADYWKVSDKYLGTATTKAEYVAKQDNITVNDVIVHIAQDSVFAKLNRKNKDVEKQIEVVEAILATLGDYDYKAIGKVYNTNWEMAEKFYAEARYFVENGEFDTLAYEKNVLGSLFNVTLRIDRKTTLDAFNNYVDATVANYNQLLTVEVEKNRLVAELEKYKTNAADYSALNATAIAAKRAEGINKIKAAKTVVAANAAYEAAIDAIDAILTTAEENAVKKADTVMAKIDAYVYDNYDRAKLSDDEEAFADRYIADVKAYVKGLILDQKAVAENVAAYALPGSHYTLADAVVTGVSYNYGAANYAGYDAAVKESYNAENYGVVSGIVNAFNTETLPKIKTWDDFFKAYDVVLDRIDPIQTKVQEDYVLAVAAAEKAFAALGTPELTKTFENALKDADTAYKAYKDAKDALEAYEEKNADEVGEVTATLDTTVYDNAAFEYARLVYLKNRPVSNDPVAEVAAFTKIANDFLATGVYNRFTTDSKNKITDIVNNTYDAINAATTDAAKAEAASKGIEALDALVVDATNSLEAQKLAKLLAEVKAEAAKYFDKYEGATFTSDAATKLDLVKDIIAFNAQFSDAAKLAKEELIKDIKGTHMKIGSSAAKGYIRISWKQSNSTVALDGVKVYRSTKKTSGFKAISTFKKQTAKKYSTNLKKGTKYYYYVKGYKVIDGVTYYTHQSITVGRTFR